MRAITERHRARDRLGKLDFKAIADLRRIVLAVAAEAR
jgi:hypothetical protein